MKVRGVVGSRVAERLRRGMGVGRALGWGAGCGPRHGMGSEFYGELNHAAPSGAFLEGLRPISSALLCSVPSAHPERALCASF